MAEETIRARIYEAVKEGKIIRVARGVYFARSGPAQLSSSRATHGRQCRR